MGRPDPGSDDRSDAHVAWDAVRAGDDHRIARARARVWSLVGASAAGVSIARWLPEWSSDFGLSAAPSWAWLAGAMLCALAGGLSPRAWAWRACALLATMLLAAGWTTARVWEAPSRDLSRLVGVVDPGTPNPGTPNVVRLEGVARSSPAPTRQPDGPLARFRVREAGWTFTLGVRRVIDERGEPIACAGEVRVLLSGAAPPLLRTGQGLSITGVLVPVERATNPGEEDPSLWARQEGLSGTLRVTSATLVTPAPQAASLVDAARGAVTRLREALRARARGVLGLDPSTGLPVAGAGGESAGRALAASLLLGERTPREEWSEAFTRLGLSHVLSISGFHLTVMAAVALWALRLTGDRGMLEPAIVGALVLAYAGMVAPSSPVVRSALMVLALLIGEALGRRHDRVCVLGWIVLALLAWRPLDLFSLGFQLSCGLTALLLWAGGPLVERLSPARVRGIVEDAPIRARLVRGVRDGALAGGMCWLVASPVVAHATGLFSPLGILATMLVGPVVVVALWLGYVMLLAGIVVPALAAPVRWALWSIADLSAGLATWLDALPASAVTVPPVPWWWALLASGALALWARFGGVRSARGAVVAIALGAALGIGWIRGAGLPAGVALRVDMLDVGDGTCVLVRSGSDALLWDAHEAPARGVLSGLVRSARSLGTHRVPRVVVTHPDIDHFSGLLDVLRPLGVREVLLPARFLEQAALAPGGAADTALRELARRGVAVRAIGAGEVLSLGPARLTILSPAPGAGFASDNDHSLVALVEAPRARSPRAARVLLTGDIGPGAIADLTRRVAPTSLLPIDALELPHHGSATPEAIAWATRVAPGIVLQSTGPSRLDDPRWAPLREAGSLGAWLATARDGAAFVEFSHNGTIIAGAARADNAALPPAR